MLDFKQKISREVWNETYKWETENIWDDSALRIAKDNSKSVCWRQSNNAKKVLLNSGQIIFNQYYPQ